MSTISPPTKNCVCGSTSCLVVMVDVEPVIELVIMVVVRELAANVEVAIFGGVVEQIICVVATVPPPSNDMMILNVYEVPDESTSVIGCAPLRDEGLVAGTFIINCEIALLAIGFADHDQMPFPIPPPAGGPL